MNYFQRWIDTRLSAAVVGQVAAVTTPGALSCRDCGTAGRLDHEPSLPLLKLGSVPRAGRVSAAFSVRDRRLIRDATDAGRTNRYAQPCTVVLDVSKVPSNASRHSALS